MNYRQAEAYVLGFTDYEKIPGIAYTAANYDLRRMEKLLQPLGNPHLGARTIHIAGTKGKGSTAAMVNQVLITAGYNTGLFTSPHLLTLRERARVNNVLISKQEFADIVTEVQPVVEQINKEAAFGHLTTFEILTAVVFSYFKRHQVDCQVLEVGLGGRLDATNIARGDVCVVTSISLDHTAVLGDTIAKIAAEKAGIIKQRSVVVNFPQQPEALKVIEHICRQQESQLIQLGRDITWRRTGGDLSCQALTVTGKENVYELTIPLLGDFQLENTAAAIAVFEALNHLGMQIASESVVSGLRQVDWPGRLQILQRKPWVVIDGAHNAYSMQKLIEAITKYFTYNNCFVIFGTSCDKDIAGMGQELASFAPKITVTSSGHPRAAAGSVVAEEFSKKGIEISVSGSVAEALDQTLQFARKTDLVLVTGSLFVVAEALAYFRSLEETATP
jgi:dihydrofolate synthase/folylpolyglutamate synthase